MLFTFSITTTTRKVSLNPLFFGKIWCVLLTMASFFGEIIEPPTRALFEDCSDEESDDKM